MLHELIQGILKITLHRRKVKRVSAMGLIHQREEKTTARYCCQRADGYIQSEDLKRLYCLPKYNIRSWTTDKYLTTNSAENKTNILLQVTYKTEFFNQKFL